MSLKVTAVPETGGLIDERRVVYRGRHPRCGLGSDVVQLQSDFRAMLESAAHTDAFGDVAK